MRGVRILVCVFFCAAAQAAEPASPPIFVRKPTAARDGEKVKIEFSVSRETDVAVYIQNGQGEVVRHLAAGALGKNAPAPLVANSLQQSLVWDGKDDDELAAQGAPFSVRVGLGLKANYAGTPFSEEGGPNMLTGVLGLAAGPDGRVYAMDSRGAWLYSDGYGMHVFRRDGSYEKTIAPFPAHLPPARVKGSGAFKNERGYLNPIMWRPASMSFYPLEAVASRQMAMTPQGHLVFSVVPSLNSGTAYLGRTARLAAIDPDGGTAFAAYAGPALGSNLVYQAHGQGMGAGPRLASASDGKSVFMVNLLSDGKMNEKKNDLRANHVIFRVPLPAMGPASIFFGELDQPGNDGKHLNQPVALAADGKGNLLVADRGNNRIAILKEADGSFVSAFPVDAPEWVGAHPKTGAVYVHSGDGLLKFVPDGGVWKEAARLTPKCFAPVYVGWGNVRPDCSFALDPSAEPPVLWIGRNRGDPALLRCEDQGTAFSEPVAADCYSPPMPRSPTPDPTRQRVLCLNNRGPLTLLDEQTGKVRKVNVENGRISNNQGTSYRLDRDGNYYAASAGGDLWKCDAHGKFTPFPATADDPKLKGHLPAGSTGTTAWERDWWVDRKGDIYVKVRGTAYHGLMHVDVYGQDGKRKRTVLYGVTDGSYGPKVDPRGNLYLMEAIKPVGQLYPAEFAPVFRDATLLDEQAQQWAHKWQDLINGSIIKFSPAGGNLHFPPRKHDGEVRAEPVKLPGTTFRKEKVARSQHKAGGELEGALWYRPGFAHVWEACAEGFWWCHCTGCDFDIDDFGRVFGPDNSRQRVTVLDTNGNLILHIGAYGNQDHCGPDSYVIDPVTKLLRPPKPDDPEDLVSPFAQPEIGLTWTVGLAVTDKHAYIADCINRRVLRVKLDYVTTETVAAP